MKILSSSPYADFNSKEWKALVSKSEKFVNTPIKVKKKYFSSFTYQKLEETKVFPKKNELHKQMQLIFS
tara:strand:- start:28 stop:234 length:207 start_codon:yes stop_codon:yes gene_type:complete